MPAAKEPRHPLEKRELLHRDVPDVARIDAIVTHLIDEGRHPEAIEYLEISQNTVLMERLATDAIKRGSAFLLQAAERLTGKKRDNDDWTALATAALGAGRYLDAVRAYIAMGDPDRAEEIRLEHCPDYDPFRPTGK